FVFGDDLGFHWKSYPGAALAEQGMSKVMDRFAVDPSVDISNPPLQPVPHLLSSLHRVRDGEYAPRALGVGSDEALNSPRNHLGLSASRTCDHHKRRFFALDGRELSGAQLEVGLCRHYRPPSS